MGWNPLKEAEKAARKAVDKIVKPAADGAKRLVDRAGNEVKNGVQKVGREVEGGVKKVGKEVESGVKKAGKEVEGVANKAKKEIPELAEKAVKEAAKAILGAPFKEVLKKAAKECKDFHGDMSRLASKKPGLVSAIDQVGYSVELKANVKITLAYSGFYSRALEVSGVLDRYANSGIQLRRRDIIGLVKAAGPSSVNFGVGAEFSLGVDLGASFSMDSIPLELFTELGDLALKRLGVPN